MRNRAKCKLCQDVIESFHRHDYVTCKCGEVVVDGGNDYFRCGVTSGNWNNFIRVDDEGNEIIPKIVEQTEVKENVKSEEITPPKLTKRDLLKELEVMIENYEKLPQMAMSQPVSHYDLVASLILLSAILRFDCNAES